MSLKSVPKWKIYVEYLLRNIFLSSLLTVFEVDVYICFFLKWKLGCIKISDLVHLNIRWVFFLLFIFNFKKLIYFSWSLITSQYCGGFCLTLTWISHGCTRVPPSWTPLWPPSPPHPSGLSQCTSFECSASCIRLALVICFTYGNIIPPLSSPTSSKCLFFTSVSLLLSCR